VHDKTLFVNTGSPTPIRPTRVGIDKPNMSGLSISLAGAEAPLKAGTVM
jgi:hypothetical protein